MNTIIHKSCFHIKNYTVIMFKEKRKNLAEPTVTNLYPYMSKW